MSNVTIYSDLQKTYTGHNDVLVKRIEDYVDAYHSIVEAIYHGKPLIVVVQNKYCMNLFLKMQNHYNEHIVIKINSPRERFQEKVGIGIPDYISEEDIVEDGILEKTNEILFNTGMNFEDNILNHYLGSYFTSNRFPFQKVVDFLISLNLSAIDASGVLKKVFKKRIKSWQENCLTESEKNIFNAFSGNYKELLYKIAKYLILKNYPNSLINDLIGELAKDFIKTGIKGDPVIPDDMDTMDIQRNIKIYLNKKVLSGLSYEDIVHEIECLSGLFDEELQHVYSLLKQNQNVLDISILHKVRSKFINGNELDSMFQEKLNHIIPPAKVSMPENFDKVDNWISWVLTSYLPYKFWMESNDITDEEVDKYSTMYGDWIFANYDRLISSESRMLYKAITNIGSFLNSDEISFIVIIDNFNYKYVSLCKEYFSSKAFSITMDQPMISMIPTETSVSKAALLSGQPFNTENKRYESMCKEWEGFIKGSVEYISDIGKLDLISENGAKLYIMNYLSIDKILHESQNNSALPISYRIQEELKAMINKIVNFSKRLGVENKIKVYFISDHGSTKISNKQENLIDSKYYKSKSEDNAYRVIALNDKKFDIYKDGIGHLCYVLDRNHFGIKENYLIARGYNRFMKTDISFYVHGGITPEENIVPFLKFERINVELIQPELLLRSDEFRYSTLSSIQLTIKNHNEYSINDIEISIMNSNIQWKQGVCLLQEIEKESQVDVCLDNIRLQKSSIEKEVLVLKIRFNFLGKLHEQNYEFPIKIKAIQENKFDFDDLL